MEHEHKTEVYDEQLEKNKKGELIRQFQEELESVPEGLRDSINRFFTEYLPLNMKLNEALLELYYRRKGKVILNDPERDAIENKFREFSNPLLDIATLNHHYTLQRPTYENGRWSSKNGYTLKAGGELVVSWYSDGDIIIDGIDAQSNQFNIGTHEEQQEAINQGFKESMSQS